MNSGGGLSQILRRFYFDRRCNRREAATEAGVEDTGADTELCHTHGMMGRRPGTADAEAGGPRMLRPADRGRRRMDREEWEAGSDVATRGGLGGVVRRAGRIAARWRDAGLRPA